MKIVRTISQMQKISQSLHSQGKTIGFVPTMGALHAGHTSLIRQARKDNDIVVASIFVNPLQFGPQEDLKRYPRPFSSDAALCLQEKVDIIFLPTVEQLYPQGFTTYVQVQGLQDGLCGAHRPGHFRGVTTVVAKLFNICIPDRAYFGQKDAQQAIIIQQMVKDMDFPINVKVMPIVRESDGLAMSSRNVYLNPQERQDALVLYQSLQKAKQVVSSGENNAGKIKKQMQKIILAKKSAKVDYIAIVDATTLQPVKKVKNNCLIALAVRIGKTRLIDNMVV